MVMFSMLTNNSTWYNMLLLL